ncbi:MAG: AbrB/MazE/SpoVT family DNA-binding domain-containing protein [Micromonosporaceae bacterium]|nr:AbrB/MazE/SpoVT family DNA-binding domain-containing protein [Micromonosporaceae bacterium]
MDASGRVGDRAVVRALGRACGTAVQITVDAGRLVAVPAPDGAHRIGAQGFVRLPARLRRRYGIEAADRVLLVGEATGVLVIYPLASLDALPPAPAGADGAGSAALAGAA